MSCVVYMVSDARSALKFALILCSSVISCALWAGEGEGRLALQGSIVVNPCTIRVGDERQALVIGNISTGQLLRDGVGATVEFTIGLRGCVLHRIINGHGKPFNGVEAQFRILFDGINEGGNFGLTGTARGMAITIRDAAGRKVRPGEFAELALSKEGDMDFRYTLTLVGNGTALQAGDHQSSVNFRIAYF